MLNIPLYSLDAAVGYAIKNGFDVRSSEVSLSSRVLCDNESGDEVPLDCFVLRDVDELNFSAVGFVDGKPACTVKGRWCNGGADEPFSRTASAYLACGNHAGFGGVFPFDILLLESVGISCISTHYEYDNPLYPLLDAFMDSFRGSFIVIPDIPLISQYIRGGDVYNKERVGFFGITPPGFESFPVIVLG